MLKPEQACQINVMEWLNLKYPHVAKMTYHLANERKCNPVQGRILKRMGVKRGVSDLFIIYPRYGKPGLWLEIKEGNGKLSKEQKGFLEEMCEHNFAASCCWGFDNTIFLIEKYINLATCNTYFDEVIYLKNF